MFALIGSITYAAFTVDTVSFHDHGITNIENFFHLITLKKIPVDKVKFFIKDRNCQISSLNK
jgi:hypothetical protein